MTENAHVGDRSIFWLVMGTVFFAATPLIIAFIWKIKKKEPISTILIGGAIFFLFALILEKPIQNLLLFPTTMGLKDHGVSIYLNRNPVLLALMAGLFPGVFEETGRLIAFKSLLKKRKNRETSISYGIGHGGFEVILVPGITYIQYIVFAFMINNGTFATLTEQVVKQAPEQLESIEAVVNVITKFSFGDLAVAVFERIFAILFHIGASILVFYACRDSKKFLLYPLAVFLHTLLDFFAALSLFNIISIPIWVFEVIVVIFCISVFLGAYLLLYKKDENGFEEEV